MLGDNCVLNPETLEATINQLRSTLLEGQVTIEVDALKFPSGQHLMNWANETKTDIESKEVSQ